MQLALLPRELSPDTVLSALQVRRGAANGITARDLVFVITGRVSAADERRLRMVIEKLRRDGNPVCSHPSLGYFWGVTAAEVEATCGYLVGRSMTSLAQASAMKHVAMPDLYGQLGLTPPNNNPEDNNP